VEADAASAEDGQRQALHRRLIRIATWLGGIAALLAVLELLGVPVLDWIDDLLDKVAAVPAWAVAGGVVLESIQTSLAAFAWYGILRAALPRAVLPFRIVLASYAAAVALNGFLPANIGTFVMLVMFTTLIVGATFPLVISGLIVEKIPFSIFNVGLYLYLFLTVSGSFSIKFGVVADHVGLILLIASGAIVLLVLLARVFWERLAKLRGQLLAGGAILRTPRRAFTRLVPARAGQLPRPALDRRRLPRRLRHSGQLPQRSHRHRFQLDLQQRLGHPGRRRRHPSNELSGPVRGSLGQDRHRLLDRPAADHLRLGRPLRDHPRLLGLRLVRRQAAGRVLLRGGEGQEQRNESEPQDPQANPNDELEPPRAATLTGMKSFANLETFPGADLIERGAADLSAGHESIEALLVSIGAPRLRSIGIELTTPIASPEHKLYALLAAEKGNAAHSAYNALIRRLVSFERAAACAS